MPKNKINLSTWGKEVKKTLIDKNMSISELAELIGYSKTYTISVINGKIVGASKIEAKINEVLGLN